MTIHESSAQPKQHKTPPSKLESPEQDRAPITANTMRRLHTDVSHLTPGDVAMLQRSIGNAAVARLLNNHKQNIAPTTPAISPPTIQRKLTVGPADDEYEQEADQIARSVQRSPLSRSAPSIQRAPIGRAGGQLQGNVEARLRRSQNSGSSLPNTVRNKIEPKLGADLGRVKIHTDSQAVQLNRELQSKAFTHKNHIYYGAGQSPSDLQLTTHETVHTIQQGAISQNTAQRSPRRNSKDGLVKRYSAKVFKSGFSENW